MSDVTLTSGKPSAGTTAVEGTEQLVDASFGAARISTRPLEYAFNGRTMGHYTLAAATGLTTGIAAAGAVYSFRWADATSLACVFRVEINAAVTTAFTTAQPVDCDLVVCRAFTASDTGGTALTPAGQFQKMRTNMGTSVVGDVRIATAAALGAGTKTADAQAIGIAAFPGNAIGVVGTPADLLNVTANGQHPLLLALNEGFNVRVVTAQGAVGVVKYYIRVDWAEVVGY